MFKLISFILLVGTIGSIELDRIGFWQSAMQLLLAGSIFVIGEQAERIKQLKKAR